MPQYADPSVLLQGQGINLPGPIDLAKGGLSLQQLFQGNQIQQMSIDQQKAMIDALQNPEVMQQVMGGGMLSPDQAQQYGPAVPKLAEMSLGFAKTRSEIGKNTADAAKLNRDTLDAALAKIGNLAASAVDTPSPQLLMSIQFQLGQIGVDPRLFGGVPSPAASTPQAMSQWFSNVATLSTSPEQRAKIIETGTMLPARLAGEEAKTGQALAETKAIPQRIGLEAYGKTTERYKPELKESATGDLLSVSPWAAQFGGGGAPGGAPGGGGAAAPQNNTGANGPAGSNQPSVRPPIRETSTATGDQGSAVGSGNVNQPQTPGVVNTGVQVKQSPGEVQLTQSAGKELDDLTARAGAAADMKAMVVDLRNREANGGLYSGGVAGTETFRTLANVLSPFLSDKQRATLASTQGWDAESKALVAQAVRQFAGARVAARELPFFESTKPSELQTPQGRELVYKMIYNTADRVQQAKMQADAYMKRNQDLGGWKPTFKDVSLPPIMITAPNGKQYPAGDPAAAAAMLRDFQNAPQ